MVFPVQSPTSDDFILLPYSTKALVQRTVIAYARLPLNGNSICDTVIAMQ
jgi:hypothetical protein